MCTCLRCNWPSPVTWPKSGHPSLVISIQLTKLVSLRRRCSAAIMDCWRERNCFVKISDSIHPEEHSLRHCSSPRQVSALMRMNKSLYVKNVNFRPLPLDVNDCKKVKSKAFGPHCTRRQWDMLLTALSAAWYAGLHILGFIYSFILFSIWRFLSEPLFANLLFWKTQWNGCTVWDYFGSYRCVGREVRGRNNGRKGKSPWGSRRV